MYLAISQPCWVGFQSYLIQVKTMELEEYGNLIDSDNIIWQDEGPENDDFSDYIFSGQAAGFRSGGGYGTNAAQYFGQRGSSQQESRQHFFWGRGYGPDGPPMQQTLTKDNDTVSFLIRCGVPKQALKGLPKVLLRLMEPECCGICGHGFDHFDGARLHYISKNHIKNQKKWLTQQAKVGSQHPKETPLKARQLYCELCDVHITSKIHADAHYSGRPHRAIVEGRKLPKNPFLLQKNMKDRVEKLIRREKKCLKNIEESETSKKVKEDPKPIPPELFCDICKASVTCTEQMTMHLNGRKHLSKEKRHIFNLMKGKTTEPNSAETADNSKDANAQSADALEKEETYFEDEFDWGHGSGTWDDDPQ